MTRRVRAVRAAAHQTAVANDRELIVKDVTDLSAIEACVNWSVVFRACFTRRHLSSTR